MKLLSTVTWLSTLPRRENATPTYSLNRARSGPYRATASTYPLCRRPRRCRRSHSGAPRVIFFMKFRGP
jgi:hypothetical protein